MMARFAVGGKPAAAIVQLRAQVDPRSVPAHSCEMAAQDIHFRLTGGYWVSNRNSVGFSGKTESGTVDFLITSEALAYLVNPDLGPIDSEWRLRRSSNSRPTYTGLLD